MLSHVVETYTRILSAAIEGLRHEMLPQVPMPQCTVSHIF